MRIHAGMLLLLLSGVSWAGKPATRIGDDARNWLELQRGHEQASESPDRVAGEVADRAYQRYLKSFDHPIPEQYPRAGFVESQ